MNNLIQKWIIWNSKSKRFLVKGSPPFNYSSSPDLAKIYSNYSDAIMACNHYNTTDNYHHPVELKFHFNLDTLQNYHQT